jgi:hypothetical protein
MHAAVSSSGAGDQKASGNDSNTRLKIIDLFKFPRPLREVFMAVVRNGQGVDLEEHLPWLMGEGPYGECMTHSEVAHSLFSPYLTSFPPQIQWLISTYVSIQNLQDPNQRASLILPTTDPLYSHLSRLKGIQKEAHAKKESSHTAPGPADDLLPDDCAEETSPAVADESDDQLYQMVGGVLVMPLHRSSAAAVPAPAAAASQPIHTPARWKPVTLPPPPPPQTKLSSSAAANSKHQQRKPKKEKSSAEAEAPEDLRLTKEDLMFRLKNALVPYHALLRPTGLVPPPPLAPPPSCPGDVTGSRRNGDHCWRCPKDSHRRRDEIWKQSRHSNERRRGRLWLLIPLDFPPPLLSSRCMA